MIVLYRQAIEESDSVRSLLNALAGREQWCRRLSLVLYDNSPRPQAVPAGLAVEPLYVHDGSNGGLAPAYRFALERATALGAPWLLLLDQDTTLTGEFIAEAFERIDAMEIAGGAIDGAPVGAFVPKLRAHGRVYSPESSYLYQLRRQFRRQRHQLAVDAVGIQPRALNAYNSGALLRAEAMRAVGGFPAEFWLDFLDHAVFEELDRGGYRVFVMRAVLEHDLSHADPAAVPLWRRRNVLTAQTRFVLRYGGWRERAWFRVSLLRGAGRAFRESPHRLLWKEILLQAFLLRLPSIRLGTGTRRKQERPSCP